MAQVNEFLQRIDTRLDELGRKRPWLSKESGVKLSTINSWFNNDRYPSVELAHKVADTLGVSIDYLMTGEEPALHLEDPTIKEIIEYLEDLGRDELMQTYGMLKLSRAIKLTDSGLGKQRKRA